MVLHMPQEIEVWYVLPAIRKELARVCVQDKGMTQKATATSQQYCLLIDEIGYRTVMKEEAGLFFDLLKKRHKKKCTIITSQLGFEEWNNFIGNKLRQISAVPGLDVQLFFERVVFNFLIGNGDGHFKNYSVSYHRQREIRLSPAYDINPTADGEGLKLNISEDDNSLDLDVARSVIGLFRIEEKRSEEIIGQVITATKKWRDHANKLGISKGKQDLMERAFRIADGV